MRTVLYSDLLQFMDEGRTVGSLDVTAAAIGVSLFKPPLARWEYWCTPTNCLTFGTTAGDGLHYGFLLLGNEWRPDSPVVMTYPPGGPQIQNNVVVGENLYDFLCLGMSTGYAVLEELALWPDKFAKQYPRPGQFARWVNEESRTALSTLARRFALKPWDDLLARLNRLHEEYHGLLLYSQDYHAAVDEATDV